MRSKFILLVEDDADDEALTLRAFRRQDVAREIHVARDGADALDFLFARDLHRLPQLVLLDLQLPRVDGLDVLRAIRADPATRRLPVVILTSSREEQDVVRSYDLGANSYVRKPVDFVQFTEAARELALYWLELNEVADE